MLTFEYVFQESDLGKPIYFAYAIPYSYSEMLNDLRGLRDKLMEEEEVDFKINERQNFISEIKTEASQS